MLTNYIFFSTTTLQATDIVDMRRVAMRGLPVLLGDDPTEFFKAGFVSIFNAVLLFVIFFWMCI